MPAPTPLTPYPCLNLITFKTIEGGDAGQARHWGPKLSLRNLPAAGFPAGGDWSEFSLKVDNGGLTAVSDYAVELRVTGGGLKASYFEVEAFYGGAWHKAATKPGKSPVYDLMPGSSYAADSVADLKVRMRATAEAPAAAIKVHVSGTDRRDADSKVASYASKITHDQTGGGDGVKAGAPTLTLGGLPKLGFTAGADWSEFSFHVDNSGRAAVQDYSLEMALWTLDTTGFRDGDIQLEAYAPNAAGTWGWHKIEPYGSEEAWSLTLAEVDIEKNEVLDLKLRMKFAKDAPATRLSLDTTAEGGSADRVKHRTELKAADGRSNGQGQGPKLALNGIPKAGFKAGGDWEQLALNVDNSGKEAIDQYHFTLLFFSNGKDVLRSKHLAIEIWNGTAWVPVEQTPIGRNPATEFDRPVGKNAQFDIPLRVKAAADAPAGAIVVILFGDDYGSQRPVDSDMFVQYSSVYTATTGGTGGTGTGGNQPTPDGGSKPVDNGSGTGSTNTGGTGTGTTGTKGTGTGTATTGTTGTAGTSGGQLAQTGADPATSWALGASGAALAMGAALVAGTGRRRRPTAR
ncbi:hypothetical protein [Streptomyces sp. NBC_01565]|uniref:hypothetical protein n=1 Tax=unclassified Streptomyces TaxID=2593676 RepID=UPI00224ED0FA|nr:hypothetical protein [Streptomyces sp. NBC_01565]MCX4545650.1 hypothetical protein [Streptomyces sp. NBC_01565]